MIARKSTLVFLANLVSGLLAYVGVLAIARLTPNAEELLGFVGFGIGFVGSFFLLTGLGIPSAHTKRVSEGEPLDECIGAMVFIRLVQVALSVSMTLLAVYFWTDVLGMGFETPLHLQLIFIMILYYAFLGVAGVGLTTFTARMEAAKAQSSSLAGTLARVAGMIVVALYGLGAIALAWTFVLEAVFMAAAALVLMRSYPLARPRWRLVRSYLKFAFPLALPAALVALSLNLDKALIQLFWGVTEVGYYFTVQRIVQLLTLLTSAVSLLLFPTLSQYHASNDFDLVRLKTHQSERYLSMILAPMTAFMFVYPEGVIHVLISDAFLPATQILRIFAVTAFVLALIVPRKAVLTGLDRPDLAGSASLVGAVLTLGLYPVLIPPSIFGIPLARLGPEGAALATLAGHGLLLGVSLFYSHRLVGDRIHRRVLLHLGAAAAISLVFYFVLPPATYFDWRWFHLIAYSGVFLLVYLGILVVLREFRREDLALFLDVLDPRKMARYVSRELRENNVR